MPPARSTTQMLLAYANAICVALTVGERSRRVGGEGSGAADSATASRGSASRTRTVRVSMVVPLGWGCSGRTAVSYTEGFGSRESGFGRGPQVASRRPQAGKPNLPGPVLRYCL